jgi:hypothetical protein
MNSNAKHIQGWMEEVAERGQPKKRLILDKESKTLKLVKPTDPRADRALTFTAKEATRF